MRSNTFKYFFPLLLALVMLVKIHKPSLAVSLPGNDCQTLLNLKPFLGISGASQPMLSSWSSSTSCCYWSGVTCSEETDQVTSLVLASIGLTGTISPSLANLTFLEKLDLSGNNLHGTIPPILGSLSRLQILSLNNNSLEGAIPDTLGLLPNLSFINLSKNNLTGIIPTSLFNCTQLEFLSFNNNNLTGSIPPSIANLSSLAYLHLGFNHLEGIIPADINRLTVLKSFDVMFNNFSGNVSPNLYNFSSLLFLGMGNNNLSGSLPVDFGSYLPNLLAIYLYDNHFNGPIPSSMNNASSLVEVDFSNNNFSGTVPSDLGSLVNLTKLHLADNLLEARGPLDWSFIASLSSCARLEKLDLSHNKFSHHLPDSISNLSNSLQWLRLRYNQITGELPVGIGNLIGLAALDIEYNLISGPIPHTFGNLLNMEGLVLRNNMLSGDIPPSLGNLFNMSELYLNNNSLSGNIPESFASLIKLGMCDISHNGLSGVIPKGLISISALSDTLNLSHNAFAGQLPLEVGKLRNLKALDVSHNKFSGEIPSSLGDCQLLDYLSLQGNYFNGTIPGRLSNLRGIHFLDLSQNQLYGSIPKFLEALPFLQFLNLSFNNFEGEVPTGGIFSNLSSFSITGNKNLCGGDPKLNLRPCSAAKAGLSKPVLVIIIILAILVVSLVLLLLVKYLRRKSQLDAFERIDDWNDQLLKLSYNDLKHATDDFSDANLIGKGGFGTVYRGVLKADVEVVAIKVFNQEILEASKSFIDECKVLKNIRHRNLVRILTACSSVDSSGNRFKALVYEFMSNGNLDEWLHNDEMPEVFNISKKWHLNLLQRLNIAIDIASGLDYLHNQIDTPIVHCDLKPGNILLDDDMTARICDFGISRILPPDLDLMTACIKGTIGYMPPESAMGCPITTSWDVYSFGILLLEMFTGKVPTEMENGLTLHSFVEKSFPEHINDIVDKKLLVSEETFSENPEKTSKCLISIIGVALICSKVQPKKRMEIRVALKKLEDAKKAITMETLNHSEQCPIIQVAAA